MRKTIILLIAFVAACAASYASPLDRARIKEAHYNKLADLNRSFKMAGGTSIDCFAQALSDYLPFDKAEDAESIDKANGYISVSQEGDGMYSADYAVWKCSDGKRLYIVSYYITETFDAGLNLKPGKCGDTHFSGIIDLTEDGEYRAVANVGYQAYLYDATTKMLEPIKFPVDKMQKPAAGVTPLYHLILPQKGKDIEVIVGAYPGKVEEFKLVWNGKNGFVCQQQSADRVDAYLYDKDGNFTNVRTAPKGDLKVQLPHEGCNICFILTDYNNGWWRIIDCGDAEGNEAVAGICAKAVDGYIHYSCVGVSSRNYGGQSFELRATPDDNGKVVWTTKEEIMVRPTGVNKDGSWWKIKTEDGKHEGWVPAEALCTNPLTNCC